MRKHSGLLSSRRSQRDVVASLVLFFLPFVAPGLVIFSHKGLLGADLTEFHLPHQQFIYENLRVGVIPFWNPYVYGGSPEFANPEMAPMYPVHFFPLILLGPELMLKIKYVFHLGLVGLGCFLLLRSLSVAAWLAFLGALTLQASGFVVTKIALPNVGDSASWIPLMMFLNLWFARRPSLERGLVYALLGGIMLLLFFPQITLTLILLLAILGAARFLKIRGGVDPDLLLARWIHRALLPGAEILLIVLMLRYPGQHPGHAVTGLGRLGVAALALVGALWLLWLGARRLRVSVHWRGLGRWIVGFSAVWAMAAAFASPQLSVTGEMIARSNQRALQYQRADLFTGRQAYGSLQEFVEKSGLAQFKESVNNMALGPAIYLLVAAGIAVGFHRRHCLFLLLLIGATATGVVYFGAPRVTDVICGLPFFDKFAGMSRYLAFLNVFLVVLAMLSAQMWLSRFPRRRKRGAARSIAARSIAAWIVFLAMVANLALLARHEVGYWKYLAAQRLSPVPQFVAAMVRSRLAPDERIVVDARARRGGERQGDGRRDAARDDLVPLLMFCHVARLPGLPSYSPIRSLDFDRWMEAHNSSLGTCHSDYRAGFFEPAPTAWTRALRVRAFLFPPGAQVGPAADGAGYRGAGTLIPWAAADGWRLMADPALPPRAWPETDLSRNPPIPEIPKDWFVLGGWADPHRLALQLENSAVPVWLVIPLPRYPGWVAWVNDKRAETATAYGFLQAVRIPHGRVSVRLEYRPRSFALGWICFLWAVWAWTILLALARFKDPSQRARARKILALLATGGLLLVLVVAGSVLTTVPDSLIRRILEFCAMVLLALVASRGLPQR